MTPVRLILATLAVLALGTPAAAQAAQAKAVTACGTPGNIPVVGNTYPLTQDLTGVLCSSAAAGGATEATLEEVVVGVDLLHDDLSTPATSIPPIAPAAKGDVTYTLAGAVISTATDTALISATASQTGRLHSLFCTIAGAQTLTFKDGAVAFTGGGPFAFPSGGGVLQWDLRAYPYFATTANTALNITTTTTASTVCRADVVKD